MMVRSSSPSDDPQLDFATLLEQSFENVDKVERGDLLTGTILAIDEYGIIVDVGLKRDGVVPRSDVEAFGLDMDYRVGQKVTVMVVTTEDRDGNLIVSIQQARASRDWDAARDQMERGDLYVGEVIDANKGGLIVPFGELRGFVPASHVLNMPRGLSDDERLEYLKRMVGQPIELKIIEVNPRRRRLVLSQRQAQRETREQAKDRLLSSLKEGDVVSGTVSSLRDFGAFVDLGGADGLIHLSELSWHRIRHPSEVVRVGMRVQAYVLQLDCEGRRIGLSLKRLQPNPWAEIEETYHIGQVVEGTVSRVVSFGAFVELDNGIEALLHVSEVDEPAPQRMEDVVKPGDRLVAQIISLEPHRQRMGLSIRHLTEEERARMSVGAPPSESTGGSEPDERAIEEPVTEIDIM